MGLLAVHGYLTPSQPPERALQEQTDERALALRVLICTPCPHNHCYSVLTMPVCFSYAMMGFTLGENGTRTFDQLQPDATHQALPTPFP